ncbi:hypothetical protein ID866_5593 [Astraeus odoratus]|nr:hypothetical protein ID866_5593 [Astraeus odoratus]
MFVQNPSELLGYVSIGCWLGAQFPQILENIKQQSCESLALPFLFNWMLGDASNLIGCLLTHQLPFQTYLATYFCIVDCCLLYQYFYYGGGPKIPPNVYAHPRSRTTSLVRPRSVDASHYRTLSAVAGSVAAAAALAAQSDVHAVHKHLRKHSNVEQLLDGHAGSAEMQSEVDETVLSALSDSFHSESGNRKRISWSQERQDHQSGHLRRAMSPIVHTTHPSLQLTSPHTDSIARARGRPLERDGDIAQEEERTERRTGSRASRRSARMVFLGVWALFGIGGLANTHYRPAMPGNASVGTVLTHHSVTPTMSFATHHAMPGTPSTHPSIHIKLPASASEAESSFLHIQSEEPLSSERVIGRIFAWLCTILYLTSRLPQIWKNYVRKSVEGLSMYLFVFAFLGNFFYVLSIVTSPNMRLPSPASTGFIRESIPYATPVRICVIQTNIVLKVTDASKGSVPVPAFVSMHTSTMEQHAFDNQRLAEARPEQLRALILDYLCHNCYTKTAQAFSKDSVVRHLDLDGDEFVSGPGKLGGTFPELSEDMIRAIAIRERIRTHILSGEVEEATIVLNEHFPAVLDESLGEEADKILSDDATSDGVQYRTVNVNPVYVALNLRILAFIEACRTIPLDHSSPISYDPTDVDFPTSVMPLECDPADEERHQMDLLIKAQKLYAHVNSLQNPTSRAVYQKELNNVGGLLAYKVPEKSPIAKYLSQERRERVAEQIDCAILRTPTVLLASCC